MNLICIVGILLALNSTEPVTAPDAGSPPVTEVQRVAIERARIEASEVSSWRKRAKMKALLPKLEVLYERRLRNFVDVNINDNVYVGNNGVVMGPDAQDYSVNEDTGQNVEVRATWNFYEAIFNPEVLKVSSEARALSRERSILLSEVNKSYFDRQRLSGEILDLTTKLKSRPRDAKLKAELLSKEVAFGEATAVLDGLTGGWFSMNIKKTEDQGLARKDRG